MATLDPQELVIGLNGNVYVAPFGTALPTTEATALNAAFFNLGLLTEDGVVLNDSRERQRFGSWQLPRPARIVETTQTTVYTLAMQQWNSDNFILAFGGGAVVEVSPGHWRYDPPGLGDTEEWSFVVDWTDQGNDYRVVSERGFISQDVEFSLTRTELAVLPLTLEVLGNVAGDPDWNLFGNSPAFVATS